MDVSFLLFFLARMDEFSVEVHHGGKLLNNPIRYEGDAINYFHGNERDCWFAQELRNMIGKLGYMSYGKLWYRMPMVSLEDGGLRPVSTCERPRLRPLFL